MLNQRGEVHSLPFTHNENRNIQRRIPSTGIVSISGTHSIKDIQGRTEISYKEEHAEHYNSQYELRQTVSQKNINHDNGANFERTVQIEWTKIKNDGKFKITE